MRLVLSGIETFKKHPEISPEALGERLGMSRRMVQKYIKTLKENGRTERVSGRRYGHWKVNCETKTAGNLEKGCLRTKIPKAPPKALKLR